MSENSIIRESIDIWHKYHEPLGITLPESKRDWLDLLNGDPKMEERLNWADLAGTVSAGEIVEFRGWLEKDAANEPWEEQS